MVPCVAWTVTCGAPPPYFSLTKVYIAFASFPLVSEACLCVLLSLSFFSSPLKTWKDSCKSLHLCFSWIKVVFLSPIFMISQGWYRYRQQILCCWRNPCMSLIVVLVKFIISGNCPHASSIWAHAAVIMGVYCIEVSWELNWFCNCNIVGGRNLTVIQLCMQIAVNLLLGALHETLRTLKGEKFCSSQEDSLGLILRIVS